MGRLVFDIETDGFLESMTTIHSLVIHDVDTGETWNCIPTHAHYVKTNPDHQVLLIEEGLGILLAADMIIGHNIIKFDIPSIQKIYPNFEIDDEKIFDTLVASRLIWTNLLNEDMNKIRRGQVDLLPKEAGLHRLESWGKRLGEWKGDYSEMMKAKGLDPWAEWNQEMQDYCVQDVVVNTKFYHLILKKNYSQQALDLEHGVAIAMAEVERNGYAFDVEAAEKLYVDLAGQRAEETEELRSIFQPWEANKGKPFTAKANNKKYGYVAGQTYQRKKTVVFNPGSRDQIADRLKTIYGWEPSEFTPTGKTKINETILEELEYPEAKRLAKYMMLQKVLGMISDGDNAWLKMVKKGRIHGNINTNGAVTGRATHNRPNVGQVPSVKKPYGKECRALFGKTYQLGCDVSGLELRMLGHFMARHDNGKYAEVVINGDIHTVNKEAAGLTDREIAKTFIYAFLYGAGNKKIGSIVGKGALAGGALRKRFLKQLPALKKLITGVKGVAKNKGKLQGLDGRHIHIRSSHAALNSLLQCAGAVVCKQWIVEFVKLLKEHGYYQKEVKIVAWIHDELQMEIDPSLVIEDPETGEYSSVIGELCIEAIVRAGDHFDLRVPLSGEYKIGHNWKDCH